MTTMPVHRVNSAGQRSDRADALLEGLAAQDFDQLGGAFTADARLRALLPLGLREWAGANTIADQFARWFGDTAEFQLIDASTGDVGGRLHLQWRLRLRAERLGAGWFTVEQHAYADTGDDGRIGQLDLLCTGYRAEHADDGLGDDGQSHA